MRAVAGCTPYLVKYSRDRVVAEQSGLETQLYAQAFRELNDFMIIDGIEFVHVTCCILCVCVCVCVCVCMCVCACTVFEISMFQSQSAPKALA